MSSATTTSDEESVGSCRPPTPPIPPTPAPAAPRGAPVRRQLDFAGGGDLEDDDEFLCRVVDDIERGYNEAKRRAPPCVCGRGVCAVERDEQRGSWIYICSARPKCKHVAFCEEVDLYPKSQPALRSDPKPSNPCVFNLPSNHVADARTPINNINHRSAGATTPISVRPQGAVAITPFNGTSQGAGATTPVNVSPKGAGATALVKHSPRGAKSNGEGPICQCTAGKCKKLRVGKEDWYVCPIPKGQGACSHKVRANAAAEEPSQPGDNNTSGDKHLDYNANGSVNPTQPKDDEWPFDVINNEIIPTAQATPCDEIRQESPSMLHLRIPMVETPTKSPVPPYGTRCPITPCSDICFRCREKGHWSRDCPKSSPGSSACYHCGMVGHWRANCPQLRGS